MNERKKIVVVKKRKAEHGGHHGGSWKVAYADFVTAMMAFFLVMWIMGMEEGVRDLVQGYFTNPVGFQRGYAGGANPLSSGTSALNMQVRGAILLNRRDQAEAFENIAREIDGELDRAGLLDGLGADVEVVVTDEGLRIELMETDDAEILFSSGSADLRPRLREVLGVIASELGALPHEVVVEGHTDAVPFGLAAYTNWELSVDRANAARRALLSGGLQDGRVSEVRGYAERQLKIPGEPRDPRNRRISLFLPFTDEVRLEVVPSGSPRELVREQIEASIARQSGGGR
jgi:chemotaxis protein MotB